MKNLKAILLIVGIIGFILFNLGNKTTVAKGELDLFTLASGLQAENILINGWSLHAREKLENFQDQQDVEEYVQTLKDKFPEWDWVEETNADHWEISAVKQSNTVVESIKIMTTLTKGKLQAYTVYEAKGRVFDEKTDLFLKKDLSKKLSNIFRGNATIFSCIKGEFNDNIDTSLSDTVKNLLNHFQATEIEALKESSFISTSAKSPLFAEKITSNNKDMNLQIGIRSQGLGAKTTVVVGTPIITIEY